MSNPENKPDDKEVIVLDLTNTRRLIPIVVVTVLLLIGIILGVSHLMEPKVVNNSTPATSPATVTPAGATGEWRLTFADEFDGDTLDTTKWIDSYPDGVRTHANNEQQYYATDGWKVKGGNLILTAERRQSGGGMPYTSGMVTSYGKFSQKYGRFEMKAKFPGGKGMWPAFWLLPASKGWPPEIDIIELVGHKPKEVLLSNHWSEDGRHDWQTGTFVGPDFTEDYHVFSVEWSPEVIIWYVDGVEKNRSTRHVPQEEMYILANLAVGGDLPGMPDEKTLFPGKMEVDYIRAYARTP